MVISIACSSDTWRKIAGMVVLPACCEPASLASNELKPAVRLRPHEDRLDHSIGGNGSRKFGQLLFVDVPSRLKRVAIDVIARNLARPATLSLSRCCGGMNPGKQRV
jgi:hypothetical protein